MQSVAGSLLIIKLCHCVSYVKADDRSFAVGRLKRSMLKAVCHYAARAIWKSLFSEPSLTTLIGRSGSAVFIRC